jgi:hypothetical protein
MKIKLIFSTKLLSETKKNELLKGLGRQVVGTSTIDGIEMKFLSFKVYDKKNTKIEIITEVSSNKNDDKKDMVKELIKRTIVRVNDVNRYEEFPEEIQFESQEEY